LGASFAWTLINATNTIDFAFTEDLQDTSGWVAWGINPTGIYMPGTQALAAFSNSSGVVVKEYNVTQAVFNGQANLMPGPVSLNYTDISAVLSGTTMTIFGTLALGAGKATSLNHVWNRGPSVNSNSTLAPHPVSNDNIQGFSTIDMSSGIATASALPHQSLKNKHGIINAVSWGILLPIGVMAARYLRPFAFADPLWLYIHVTCQITGYILGIVGWGMGIQLEQYANPIQYRHRNLGVAIFTLATLQVLSGFLRPKKDAKVRIYWNVFHHTIGFATIIIIIVNIFEGIHLLQPDRKWKKIYIIVIAILAAISLVMEIITWIVWFRRRQVSPKRLDHPNGVNRAGQPEEYKFDHV
jgi:hypothetical protein